MWRICWRIYFLNFVSANRFKTKGFFSLSFFEMNTAYWVEQSDRPFLLVQISFQEKTATFAAKIFIFNKKKQHI